MKKPSEDELRQALIVGHFGVDTGPLPASDPVEPTPMVLPIIQIESYDRNPRRAANEKYEELKESIRLNGLRQPLVITRRPAAPRYMPKHGGNTRLVILKELRAETGEIRFATANCLFEPWTTESDVLVGHLVENEMRGDLVFIDKARAVRESRQLIEQETGGPLTQRQLADALRARGYRISQSVVSHCEYAVDTLLDAIPRGLGAGMGKPKVERLRQLDRAAQAVWIKRQLGPDDLYRSVFTEALARVDTEHLEFDRARQSLERAMADRAGAEPRHITLELGAELDETHEDEDFEERLLTAARTAPREEELFAPAPPAPPAGAEPRSPPAQPASPSRAAAAIPIPPPAQLPSRRPAERRSAESFSQSDERIDTAAAPVPAPMPFELPDPPEPADTDSAHLTELRRALRDCALDFARHSELTYCLRFDGSPWIRLGFIVADFPAPAQVQQLVNDLPGRAVLAWKWYELTRCCDLLQIADHIERLYGGDADAKQRVFAELFGTNPRYLKAWASPEACLEAIADAVGILDLQQFSFYAERVGDEAWQAGMRMVQAYRDLKSYAYNEGIDLMQDDLPG